MRQTLPKTVCEPDPCRAICAHVRRRSAINLVGVQLKERSLVKLRPNSLFRWSQCASLHDHSTGNSSPKLLRAGGDVESASHLTACWFLFYAALATASGSRVFSPLTLTLICLGFASAFLAKLIFNPLGAVP
jgi:hypothetical protein